jgi:integrase
MGVDNTMAKQIERLNPLWVARCKKPGYHADGDGLYLQVSNTGSKSWVLRFMLQGKAREMGLGSLSLVPLAEARQKAKDQRKLLAEGIDPIAARDAQRNQHALEQARRKTFDECAEAYIEAHRAGWRNAKHAEQWTATLSTYASPVFGALPVQAIDTALVMKSLEPIWCEKTETASRVRGRVESVLDWATVRGYRSGENPARWRGHLDKLLPRRSKVAKVKHHEALSYSEVAVFMRELHKRDGVAPKALEFVILTAARVSEAVNAKWGEIDLQQRLWTVPAERMKASREHRVPLCDAAVKLLKAQKEQRQSEYVFPGWRVNRPLTGAACLKLLDDMDRATLTVHGFRSTFRDWCAEQTNYPREIAEAALAHVLSDKTEAAYQRGDLLERRRLLMQAWADYCGRVRSTGKVTQIRKAG